MDKLDEAKELRQMRLDTPMARMFRDAMADDLENEAKGESERKALKAEDNDFKWVVENLVSCLEHWDSVDKIERLRKLRYWLETGKKQ